MYQPIKGISTVHIGIDLMLPFDNDFLAKIDVLPDGAKAAVGNQNV